MLFQNQFIIGNKIEIQELSISCIVREIHAGGVGCCVHLETLDKHEHFALKNIRPDFIFDDKTYGRFIDEIKVWLEASSCDGVVEAVQIIKINEVPCVLSRWMEGGDLSKKITMLNPEQKLSGIIRMALTMQWVYQKMNVIHRDLKPANILLDKQNQFFVGDWGLSRPIASYFTKNGNQKKSSQDFKRLGQTISRSFLGTVMYAAPEQFINASAVDHRADIYALGCIMYELETGIPPYSGNTFNEFAQAHLYTPIPKLGGIFNRTKLGLELIIQKCLQKNVTNRFQTYDELLSALFEAAKKRQYDINNSRINIRYIRHQPGKGLEKQKKIMENIKYESSRGWIEREEIIQFLNEADNLCALGKYEEAMHILTPYYIPEIIVNGAAWHGGHSLIEFYAYCVTKMGEPKISEKVYEELNTLTNKPAVFYVNYGLTLLNMQKFKDAIKICKAGDELYPNDYDILGNLTIALQLSGKLDEAEASAFIRLNLRRDVHSLEEAVMIIHLQMNLLRYTDLPRAAEYAKTALKLTQEGLLLNPRFNSLQFTKIQLLRFCHDGYTAFNACKQLIESPYVNITIKELAFLQQCEIRNEIISQQADVNIFINDIDNSLPNLKTKSVINDLLRLRMKTIAEKLMLGKTYDGGSIVYPEVVDFFLRDNEKCLNPVMCARIIDYYSNPNYYKNGKINLTCVSTNEVDKTCLNKRDIIKKQFNEQLSEWQNQPNLALLILEPHTSTDWEACKWYVMISKVYNNIDDAYAKARNCILLAPWKAESYDILTYVAQHFNDIKLMNETKIEADAIFHKEKIIFNELQKIIVALGS